MFTLKKLSLNNRIHKKKKGNVFSMLIIIIHISLVYQSIKSMLVIKIIQK